MSRGVHRTWQGALVAAALLVSADLTSRLAYSDAAVAARVDMAVRQTFEGLPERDDHGAERPAPRLRVTALP
jgi:hypothetical protein